MTELSPQAQAVYDAVREICPAPADEIAAAALKAAADQVFPVPNDWDKDNISEQGLWLLRLKRDQLLAIAAELEAR